MTWLAAFALAALGLSTLHPALGAAIVFAGLFILFTRPVR